MGESHPDGITLSVKQLKSSPAVQVNDSTLPGSDYTFTEDGTLRLTIRVTPGKATECAIRQIA